MEETMTSTERWGPRLCKTKHISAIWHISICSTESSNTSHLITKLYFVKEMDLEERSKWKPHLDVLHFLQSKVRDCRFFGFACWRDVTEEFGEEKPLWMTATLFQMQGTKSQQNSLQKFLQNLSRDSEAACLKRKAEPGTCLYVLSATHIMKKKRPLRKTLSTMVIRKNTTEWVLGFPAAMMASSLRVTEFRRDTSSCWANRKQKGSRAKVAVTSPPKTR